MKKLIYFTGITCMFFLTLYLNSCDKDTEVKSRKAMNVTTTDIHVEKMNGDGVKVVCNGNCDGSIYRYLWNKRLYCKWSECCNLLLFRL